jgi:hypothetical protein
VKGCFKFLLYGIGAVVALLVVVAVLGGNNSQSTRSSQTAAIQSGSSSTPATATPDWMAPSFEEMCNNNDTMTDIQQEEYAKSMAGKKIVGWAGKVYDVERDGDTFKVQVDVSDGLFKARQVEILGVSAELAPTLNVDQEISFDGTIQSVEMFADNICNPINIVDATITPR